VAYIRTELGSVIGEAVENGDTITYRSVKKGIVGFYDKQRKRYVRILTYKNKLPHPLSEHDYGLLDVLYWEGQL
jgi:benzoyl-CoA reductase/2-hydroxyglutaryl-CoA dehydratase subunit BcrC/BadD/HgdB